MSTVPGDPYVKLKPSSRNKNGSIFWGVIQTMKLSYDFTVPDFTRARKESPKKKFFDSIRNFNETTCVVDLKAAFLQKMFKSSTSSAQPSEIKTQGTLD